MGSMLRVLCDQNFHETKKYNWFGFPFGNIWVAKSFAHCAQYSWPSTKRYYKFYGFIGSSNDLYIELECAEICTCLVIAVVSFDYFIQEKMHTVVRTCSVGLSDTRWADVCPLTPFHGNQVRTNTDITHNYEMDVFSSLNSVLQCKVP